MTDRSFGSRFTGASDLMTMNEPPAAAAVPTPADFLARLHSESSFSMDYPANASDYFGSSFSNGNHLPPPPYDHSSDSNDVICTGTSFSCSQSNGGFCTSYGADRLADQFNSTLHRFNPFCPTTKLPGEPLDLSVVKSRNMTANSDMNCIPFDPLWEMKQSYFGGCSQRDSFVTGSESTFNWR